MKIMSFWWRQERKMISTVRDDSRCLCNMDPKHECSYVASHNNWSDNSRQDISKQVLQGVTVDCHHTDGSSPLVVDLVNVTVDPGVMENPEENHRNVVER